MMGNSSKTVVVPYNDASAWDAFVLAQPRAEYCHLFHWSRVIEEVYQHRPRYLAAVNADADRGNGRTIRGVFPLFHFKPLFKGSKLVSIPYFDQAGPLAGDRQTETLLFQAGARLLRGENCTRLEIRQASLALYAESQETDSLRSTVSNLKVSLKLQLEAGREEMMRRFKAKLRSQISKGMKNGLQTQIGKEELLQPFYQVFSRNMRDLGSPVHSRKFFQTIFKYFRQDAFICLVTLHAQPVAAGFLFRFKDEMKNPWASSLKEFRHLNTNMLLYWTMIRFACDEGMRCFDMGRSSRGASTYRFKQQWGPEEKPLFWYSWSLSAANPNERPETLIYPALRKLPMFAANLLGPLLRRGISL